MEYETSPINADIEKIIHNREKDSTYLYSWDCYFRIRYPNDVIYDHIGKNKDIFTPEEEAENVYRPLKLLNATFVRDYLENAADVGHIKAVFGAGQWFKILQHYRDFLEVVVVKIPRKKISNEDDPNRDIEKQVYYAVPLNRHSKNIETHYLNMKDRKGVDTFMIPEEVEFQLLDLSFEQLRGSKVGITARDTTGMDVAKFLIADQAERTMLTDGTKCIEAFDVVEPDNKEKRQHVIIPQGTPALDVPEYIQENCGGIYSNGINTYIQNKICYIYPPYDLSRLEKTTKTLTIFKLPDHQYDDAENTYRKDGDKLQIVAQSLADFNDLGKVKSKDEGQGHWHMDARRFMAPGDGDNKAAETKGNELIANPKNYVYAGLNQHQAIKIQDTNNNVAPFSPDKINANSFSEASIQSAKLGNYITMTWTNSDASLLYPCMPVKVIYAKGQEEIGELHGVLHGITTAMEMQGKGVTSDRYRQITSLVIYVVPPEQASTSGADSSGTTSSESRGFGDNPWAMGSNNFDAVIGSLFK